MAHTSSSVTLADIARLSGVGMGTASRALSNAPGVATNTRQRVLAVAEELHYVVSPDASALAKGATGRIGLLVPHLSRWHFGAVVEGLNEVLRDADLDVLLYQVGNMEDRARFFERLPPRRKVDALVVIGFPVAEDERRRLELMGVHIVTVAVQAGRAPLVHIDDYAAGRRAVDYLVNLGHRRIAMIEAIDPDLPGLVPQRSVAYYEALGDAGIAADPSLVASGDWGGEQGSVCMGGLLSLRVPPTAVYAHSDEIALGAIRTIRRAGLRIPQDISVMGIDDHPLASLTDLSTVRQDPNEQGRMTANTVLALLGGGEVQPVVTTPTTLIVRGTTAPPGPVSAEVL
ncbi:MAG: LacI family DNA-binding transcriptional regulator [Pedococcus sp.]